MVTLLHFYDIVIFPNISGYVVKWLIDGDVLVYEFIFGYGYTIIGNINDSGILGICTMALSPWSATMVVLWENVYLPMILWENPLYIVVLFDVT